jgi:hypothetical protein
MRAQWRYLRWGFEGPSPVFDLAIVATIIVV